MLAVCREDLLTCLRGTDDWQSWQELFLNNLIEDWILPHHNGEKLASQSQEFSHCLASFRCCDEHFSLSMGQLLERIDQINVEIFEKEAVCNQYLVEFAKYGLRIVVSTP